MTEAVPQTPAQQPQPKRKWEPVAPPPSPQFTPQPANGTRVLTPCVGMPVQYHNGTELIPAFLQRRSVTNPELWDCKISLAGSGIMVTRAAVAYSPTPKTGCWSFQPWMTA